MEESLREGSFSSEELHRREYPARKDQQDLDDRPAAS